MLIHAIKTKQVDKVKYITDRHNIKDAVLDNGLSIVWKIDFNNYEEADRQILEILFKRNLDIESPNGYYQTLLHRAVETSNVSLFEDLLGYGAEVDPKDYTGQTPLHYAVYNCNFYMCYSLIELGANINEPDHDGETPFTNLVLGLFSQIHCDEAAISSIEDIFIENCTKKELNNIAKLCNEHDNQRLYNKIYKSID
jgi:ankyrin repeat protein